MERTVHIIWIWVCFSLTTVRTWFHSSVLTFVKHLFCLFIEVIIQTLTNVILFENLKFLFGFRSLFNFFILTNFFLRRLLSDRFVFLCKWRRYPDWKVLLLLTILDWCMNLLLIIFLSQWLWRRTRIISLELIGWNCLYWFDIFNIKLWHFWLRIIFLRNWFVWWKLTFKLRFLVKLKSIIFQTHT